MHRSESPGGVRGAIIPGRVQQARRLPGALVADRIADQRGGDRLPEKKEPYEYARIRIDLWDADSRRYVLSAPTFADAIQQA